MAAKKKAAEETQTPKKSGPKPHKAPTEKQWDLIVRHTLTRSEYELLAACQYDSPRYIETDHPDRKVALKLKRMGLLESNPTNTREFRCTERGEDLRKRYDR